MDALRYCVRLVHRYHAIECHGFCERGLISHVRVLSNSGGKPTLREKRSFHHVLYGIRPAWQQEWQRHEASTRLLPGGPCSMSPSLSGKPLMANFPSLFINCSKRRRTLPCESTTSPSSGATRRAGIGAGSPLQRAQRATHSMPPGIQHRTFGGEASARQTFSLKNSESNVLLSESL